MNLESVILTELNAYPSTASHLTAQDREQLAKKIADALKQEAEAEKSEWWGD